MLEAPFRKKVDVELKKLPNSHWFSIQQIAIRGTPDKLGCLNGTFVALEYKRSGEAKRSALQKRNIRKINEAGGYGRFVYPENWAPILQELKGIANG